MQLTRIAGLALLSGLAGCATLPTSGPTGKQIERSIRDEQATLPISLVEVSTLSQVPATVVVVPSPTLQADLAPPPTDMIGPGDVLDITIYEAGVTLFAGGGGGGGGGAAAGVGQASAVSVNPGVQAQKLPLTRVNDDGDIVIPYAGRLHVLGHTVGETENLIRRSLRRLSQDPQVIVTLNQTITNSVIVGGEVAKPGRLVLQTNRETLSDVIALAGGYRGNTRDLQLRLTRRGETTDLRFDDLTDTPSLDVRAYPGDRLTLIAAPRSFSVMGAPGRVEQFPFNRSATSLAEAISSAGGISPNGGDPKAIFVFRYVPDAQGNRLPVVYHFNMMHAGTYFLAQRFAMQDKDVLYFGNAAANQPGKLFQLISQLFTPLATVTAGVQTVSNSN